MSYTARAEGLVNMIDPIYIYIYIYIYIRMATSSNLALFKVGFIFFILMRNVWYLFSFCQHSLMRQANLGRLSKKFTTALWQSVEFSFQFILYIYIYIYIYIYKEQWVNCRHFKFVLALYSFQVLFTVRAPFTVSWALSVKKASAGHYLLL